MPLELNTLPRWQRRWIKDEIGPEETLEWVGQPAVKIFTRENVAIFLLGLQWLMMTGIWIFATWNYNRQVEFFAGLNLENILRLLPYPFFLLGLSLIVTPMLYWWRRLRTVYVLTDRHAIVFLPGWTSVAARSFRLEQIDDLYRAAINRDGSGSIFFAVEHWHVADTSKSIQMLGFEDIQNVRTVERLIWKLHQTARDRRNLQAADPTQAMPLEIPPGFDLDQDEF